MVRLDTCTFVIHICGTTLHVGLSPEFLFYFLFQTFCSVCLHFHYPQGLWLKSLEQSTICRAERLETFKDLNFSLNLNHIFDANKGTIEKNDLSNN